MGARRLFLAISIIVALCGFPVTAWAQWQADGTPVCVGSWGKQHPTMVPDGTGGVIVVWEDSRASGTSGFIYAQRLDDAGVPQWTPNGIPLDLSRTYSQTGVVATTDQVGGVIVAWIEYTGVNEVIRAQRINGSGVTLWSSIVCGAPSLRRFMSIVSDGVTPLLVGSSGGAVIAWTDDRYGGTAGADVFAQHLGGNGVTLWTVDGVAVSTAAGQQWAPTITTDGIGSITSPKSVVMSWLDTRTDPGDIYAQRLSAGGVPQWTADGAPVCMADSSQGGPAAVFVGSGNVILCWNDLRNGHKAYDLFAQRVGSSGAWSTATGVPVCVTTGRASQQQLVSDGGGGALAVWTDDRNGGISDIYAQRIDATGAAQWLTNGVPVCMASAMQSIPLAVTDISGGMIVAWLDYRGGSESDIYAERVNGAGISLWATNGIRLCHADGSQITRAIAGDGSGGAIVLWEDGRAANPGLYAQHVTGGGGALAVGERARTEFHVFASPDPTPGPVSIRFELPSARRVTARVMDAGGRVVATLADNAEFGAGPRALAWDGRDGARGPLSSGVYFVSVRAGDEHAVRRVLIFR